MNKEAASRQDLDQEDQGWVASFQRGDKKAFDRLVLKYQRKVFNICYRFLGDYDEANDSAQETFVKVYRALAGFRGDARFSTWLYRIAVNTCKNKVGSLAFRMGRRTRSVDAPKELDENMVKPALVDASRGPDDEYEGKEKMSRIQKAMETLPGEQRSLVVLRDIEGLSYEEIGEATGLQIGTVKSKLSRAREKLRDLLKGII